MDQLQALEGGLPSAEWFSGGPNVLLVITVT